MNPRGTILVFAPPPWPIILTAAALLLLSWEIAGTLRAVWRGRGARSAVAMTVCLLGGPLTALVVGVYGWTAGSGDRPAWSRSLVGGSLKATVLAGLVLLIRARPAEGSLVAIALCAAVWAVRSYRRTTSQMRGGWKAALLALRVAALLLTGLWALGPQLEYAVDQAVRRTLIVAVDTSASMQRRDVPAGGPRQAHATPGPSRGEANQPEAVVSRIEAVSRELQDAWGDLEEIARSAGVGVFAFDSAPQPIATLGDGQTGVPALPAAVGAATAIGDSLQAAADHYLQQGAELAAIVVISDGCNNTAESVAPESFASRMALSGVPVHAVGVGSDQVTASTLGLSVQELACPEQIGAFNRLPIRATVEALGLAGRTVRVSYTFGEEPNAPAGAADDPNHVQVFQVASARQSLSASFVHVPLASGFHRLTVRAECVDPPRGLAGQMGASKLVQVVDRELRVLYLEGQYRYEVKFVTQALASAERFVVDRRILLQPLRGDVPPPLGEDLDDWLRYHAILLGDLPAASLSAGQHQLLKDLVGRYGKGLCMIGGERSFGRGGWQDTPLADVMPVRLDECAEQIRRELRVAPTPEGLTSEVMNVGREGQGVAAAWKELSAMPGANRLGGLKPGAETLARTADGEPLIVVQTYGKGRSMAIAFDTTWLWVTTKDTGDYQKRFWRQVALYLCAPKGNAWITTDKAAYELRRLAGGKEAVEVTAGVEDTRGIPMPDQPVQVALIAPTGREVPLELARQDERRTARLSAVQLASPGTYRLRIQAEVAGRPVSAEHRFEVHQRDLEAMDVLANLKLLQRLAEEGKGRYAPLSELRGLLAALRPRSQPKIVAQVEHFDLGASLRWPVIAALIALVCLEWALRKRRGLV